MKRRRFLLTAVGAGAAAAGAGFAWWRLRPGGGNSQALWAHTFEQPDGQPLILSGFQGRPVIVNFWASWCAPCVREMPQLDRFYREFQPRGWQVLGLAIDSPTAVREFLRKVPVSFPIGLAGFGGTELLKSLGNPGGGLPFTVLLNPAGALIRQHLGEISYDALLAWSRIAV